MAHRLPVACCALAALAGCGDPVTPADRGVLIRTTVPLVSLGDTTALRAYRITSDADTLRVGASWTSSDVTVVSIEARNLAVARAEGAVTITAETPEREVGRATLEVRQRAWDIVVLVSSDTVAEADTLALDVALRDARGNPIGDREVAWSVSPLGAGRVDATRGSFIALRKGAVTVRAFVDGTYGERTVTVSDGFVVRSMFNSTFQGRVCAVDLDSLAGCWFHGAPVASNVSDTIRFRSFTSGDNHFCGTTVDDRAICFGSNGSGQLGLGYMDGWHDTLVTAWPDRRFRFVAAADHDFTCGVTTAGESLCWGHNDTGQLGRGDRDDSPDAAAIVGVAALDTLDVEGLHACGLARGGAPYCWGSLWADQAVPIQGGFIFTQITAGWQHTCGLTAAGEAFCWGNLDATPEGVLFTEAFRQISAGSVHTCGVTLGAGVACWGDNDRMQLGVPGPASDVPQLVPGLPPIVAVASGDADTCVLTDVRAVLCWGGGSLTPRRVRRSGSVPSAIGLPPAATRRVHDH